MIALFRKSILLIVSLSLLLLIQCNDNFLNHLASNCNDNILDFFDPDTLLYAITDSIEEIDAVQLFMKSQQTGIELPGSLGEKTSFAKAMYYLNGCPSRISFVECNGKKLDYYSQPIFYRYYWDNNEVPECNSKIYWETKFNKEILLDTIPIPYGFNNLAFTSDSLDINKGGLLTWDSSNSGEVAFMLYWTERFKNGETGFPNSSFLGIFPDNGSFMISAQILRNANIPDSASKVEVVTIVLFKWNINAKKYDSNKTLVNIAMVNSQAMFWVKQE